MGGIALALGEELYGTGLTTKDRARVMRQCGQEDPSDLNITAVYDEMGHLFDFGRLSASDGMLALTYKVGCSKTGSPSLWGM